MKWHLEVMSAPMKSALLDLAGSETTGAVIAKRVFPNTLEHVRKSKRAD